MELNAQTQTDIYPHLISREKARQTVRASVEQIWVLQEEQKDLDSDLNSAMKLAE